MEIARIKQEKKIMENKMASHDAQMAAQAAALAKMQALLEANGIIPAAPSVLPLDKVQLPGPASFPGPSGVTIKNGRNHASSLSLQDNRVSNTTSRKRRSSQPLGGTMKDSRFSNNMLYVIMEDEMDLNFLGSNSDQTTSQARVQAQTRTQASTRDHAQRSPVTVSEFRGVTTEDNIEPIFAVKNATNMRQEIGVSFENSMVINLEGQSLTRKQNMRSTTITLVLSIFPIWMVSELLTRMDL
jgi:hypothetical protein